eukprot:scaffold133623_cov55-Attheya_sp.AAC.1
MSHVVLRRTACSILWQRQPHYYTLQQRLNQPSRTIVTITRTGQWLVPSQLEEANANRIVTTNQNHHPRYGCRVVGPTTNGIVVRRFARAIRRPKRPKKCPWGVLGIVKHEATVADAKRAFLKIAMNHHPDMLDNTTNQNDNDNDTDTNNNGQEEKGDGDSSNKKEDSVAIFMGAREALDALLKDPTTGLAALRVDVEAANNKNEEEERMTDAQFDAWFRSETGHDMPFGMDSMDPATMMEVAEMNDNVGHGLDRDGGMWQLASLISANVKSKKDGSSPQDLLRLDAGDPSTQSNHINPGGAKPYWGSLRRRRR